MKTIKWTGSKGQTIELRAECETKIVADEINADGYIINVGNKVETKANLELWIDDKKIDSCWNTNFWTLIDAGNGIKKIWGLKVGMIEEQAEKVEKFLKDVMESGKTEDVKARETNEKQIKKEKEIKSANEILENAKTTIKNQDGTLMTNVEAKEWKMRYNNIHNDGGEGYIPNITTKEQYDNAVIIIEGK